MLRFSDVQYVRRSFKTSVSWEIFPFLQLLKLSLRHSLRFLVHFFISLCFGVPGYVISSPIPALHILIQNPLSPSVSLLRASFCLLIVSIKLYVPITFPLTKNRECCSCKTSNSLQTPQSNTAVNIHHTFNIYCRVLCLNTLHK
jgi:hypothetical protein